MLYNGGFSTKPFERKSGKNVTKETYEGVPRNKIPWHPTINYEKCITCGKCVDFCSLGVFELEEEGGKKKTIIKNPDKCVVFCKGCEEICPTSAISHPSKKVTREIIRKLKKRKPKALVAESR